MKKVFLITMFGSPFSWTQQYIDNVQHLEKDGWYWKIFTPNEFESKGNVEIVKMDTNQFNELVEEKLGVKSNVGVTEGGIPTVHMTEFYIFSGIIFADYIKDADFWGITNMDVVYGNLSRFVSESILNDCDVFTDDVNTVNGVFSLWRNIPAVNLLYQNMIGWGKILGQPECVGCAEGDGDKHSLYGSDEYIMTDILKLPTVIERVRYRFPAYYPMLSHDRLEQHVPTPKLEIKKDGSLWELFRDTDSPKWEHARLMIGKEIPYFHFQRTKRWPL